MCIFLIYELNSILYLLCGNPPIILSPSSLHTPMALAQFPSLPLCYQKMSAILLHSSPCHIWQFTNPTDLSPFFFCWDTDFPIFLSQVTGFWASPSLKSLQRNTLSQRQDGHTFFSFCLQPLLVAFYCGLWSKCLHWMWRFTWKVSICSFSLLKIYFSPMKCHLRSLLLLSWVFCVGGISLWGYNAPSFSSEMWKNLCVHSAQLSHCPLHWWSKDRRKPDMRSFFMFIFT